MSTPTLGSATSADAARPHCIALLIPGRKPGEKYAEFVTNVLSAAECQEWIAFAESKGFAPASLLADQKTKNPHRSNDRALIFDAKRAALLFERLRAFLPQTFASIDGQQRPLQWKLFGLNDRLSFLRYMTDEHYGKHVDVPHEDEATGRRSFVTVQLYLNDGFDGGTTRFVQESGFRNIDDRKHLDVVPQTGAALLFEHELTHQGMPVTRGAKYTVRVDAMYVAESRR
jgi:hypothetical protein